jgi:peptidyl-prolyl cis-trans isomerase D
MLESIRRGQKWLTGILVTLVGGVFVFFMGLGQPLQPGAPSQGTVVQLGDMRLDQADFLRVRALHADSYRDQLGDQFNTTVGSSFLDAQALRTLVDRAILAHEAHELGLRVGKEEIQRLIVQSSGFVDESGRFDKERFQDYVEYQYGNQRNYVKFMRRTLLGQKMVRLLYSQGEVSEGEAHASALYRLQQAQIEYVAFDTETLPLGSELSEEEIATYAAAREAELQGLYEDRLDEFRLESQLRLRHILFVLDRFPTPRELEEAQQNVEAALARLKAGEDFAAVASEVSEDVSTRDSGGDLGLVGPDEVAGELTLAANGLEPGQHSDAVRTDRGLHLVKLEERIEAGVRPFAEMRSELARGGATKQAAAARADEITDELAAAVRGGQSLEDAARERELTLERTGMLRRRADGFVVGLGASPELLAMTFALRLDKPSSPEIFTVGSKLVLIQLLDRNEPSETDLAATLAGERTRLRDAKKNAFVQNWLAARRTELLESGQLLIDNSVVES